MAVANDSFYFDSSLTSATSSSKYGSGSRHHESSDFSRSSHREMAIDVPDNYIYALPKNKQQQDARYAGINKSRSNKGGGRDAERREGGGRSGKGPSSQQQQQLSQSAAQLGKELDEQAQTARIRKYQDDLRKRRVDEERQQQEAEFLRTSLRGSHKLQALAKRLPPQTSGIENPNYFTTEEIESRNVDLPKEVLLRKPQSLDHLLSLIQNIQNRSDNADIRNGLREVSHLLENDTIQKVAAVHKTVVDVMLRQQQSHPVGDDSKEITDAVLQCQATSPGAKTRLAELKDLMNKPAFQQLLMTHDLVASQIGETRGKFAAKEVEHEFLYERASQYGEESIRIVRLVKGNEPLGATVKNSGESVLIGRIIKGGIAEKSDLLHEGDEILEINGIDIRGKNINDVYDIMAGLTGTLTFLTVPADEAVKLESSVARMHIRALFNYDPDEDLFIPCRELGIAFCKGDILHVSSQEDANWWQAYRDGEDDHALAGLIPSRTFWEQHESMKLSILADTADAVNNAKNGCRCLRSKKKSAEKTKSMEDIENAEILTYEEVALYYPQLNRQRPVVLVGPSNVGRLELRQRLLDSSPHRFGAAIPHTTRPARDGEVNGIDYHFVTRASFEMDIADNRFVEYGQLEKNFYGTTMDAIRQVITAGKVCVLNLYPQSLRLLKAAVDIRPFVVFIVPPNSEKLRQMRMKQNIIPTDDELKETVEAGRQMEESFGHLFDLMIVNYDLDRAYDELLDAINRLQVEPQWVPVHWAT